MHLRLLQLLAPNGRRFVVAAIGEEAFVLTRAESVRALALQAISVGQSLAEAVAAAGRGKDINLEDEYAQGNLLPPIDHEDPAHLWMTGTGLTHLGSAEGRDRMHRSAAKGEHQTDSMRMFLDGVAGGKPPSGQVGQQPEWFYKGDGSQLVSPGAALHWPNFARDGGEEPELAGIYLIGPGRVPYRLGICLANEFSDHVTERHNYLWLAHSKLRQAALGPELLVGVPPAHIEGTSRIRRDGHIIWEKQFLTGEDNMSHSLENLEHHHFKYDMFRRPGDIHVHFFGTGTISFSDGVEAAPGDVFEISAAPFRLPLRNSLVKLEPNSFAVKVL